MRIRLTGTREDTAAALAALRQVLNLVEVSDFYPNRGTSRLGRVYLEANPTTSQHTEGDQPR